MNAGVDVNKYYKEHNGELEPGAIAEKARRKYKKRKPKVEPELSAIRREAALVRYAGMNRTPYKTIRLSAAAVEAIRSDAARRGISASQAVVCALSCSALTDYQCQAFNNARK